MFVSRKWIGALCLSASSGLAVPALAQTALEPATASLLALGGMEMLAMKRRASRKR